MLSATKAITTILKPPIFSPNCPIQNPKIRVGVRVFLRFASISSLKVIWRKDLSLDQAVVNDKRWRLCARVVREVINEPNQTIPLRYLENRRKRLRLNVRAETFIVQNPLLFNIYYDRIQPQSDQVKFIRPSEKLCEFLHHEKRIYEQNEEFIVEKLCKMLMMAKNHVIKLEKLLNVKREFGFPNDFLTNLVPKYSKYFRLIGGIQDGFLELVEWDSNFAKPVTMKRAEEEEEMTGIRVRPSFNWRLPPGFFIRKKMREWVRDWMEMPYINPYEDASHLDPASREMEKRMVGVIHELLSLSLFKRVHVPVLGKLGEEYRFSNAFSNVFTRHSGLFYVSYKGGMETAMLREAYRDGVLIDRDPLLEITDRFVELLEEGWKVRAEELRSRREAIEGGHGMCGIAYEDDIERL